MAGELPPVIGSLELNIDDLIAKLDEAKQKINDFADSTADATVGVDTGDVTEKLDDIKAKIEDIDGARGEGTVGVNTGDTDEKLAGVKAEVDDLTGTRATVDVSADTSRAQSYLAELDGQIASLNADRVIVRATANIDEAEAKLAALRGETEFLKSDGTTVSINADTSGADGSINDLKGEMGSIGGMAPAVGAALASAFAVLPGVLAGVSGGFMSLFAGLHGITSAIGAYVTASHQASQTGNEMAQIALSNAQTLANAAAQVESAQMQMSQAQISSYDQVHQAQEQVVQSTQQLEAAQFAQRAAQVALTEATMAAKFQLQDYQTQEADMALQIKAAIVAQQQAQLSLAETMGDPAATQLQREQAQITYQQATQQITDLQTQYSQLQQTAAYQSAKGVAGSDAVVQAQQQVTEANYGVQNAQVAAADAQLYLQQAQIESAQNLAQAQRQLTLAIENQGIAIKQVQLISAQPIGANAQIVDTMNALTPAGQKFVTWWQSNMGPVIHQLYGQAQNALLPGLEKMLKTLKPYLEQFGPVMQKFGQGFLKDFADPLAKFLSSKKGMEEFKSSMENGLKFMAALGGAIIDVVKAFGILGSDKGLMDAVVLVVRVLGDAFVWVAQHIQTVLMVAGTIAIVLGGPIVTVIGIVTLFIGLFSAIVDNLGALKSAWDSTWSAIKHVAGEVWHWIDGNVIHPIARAFMWLVDEIRTHWELVLAIITGPIGLAVLFIKNNWNTISTDTSNLVNNIVNWFEQLPTKIMNALSTLGQDFLNLGSQLIQFLIQGITSAPAALGNALLHLIPGGGVISNLWNALIGSGNSSSGSSGGTAAQQSVRKYGLGGLVTMPTPAIVGDGGPELILPLNNPQRMAQLLTMVATTPPLTGGGMPSILGSPSSSPMQPNQTITVYAQTNANPQQIANEIGWAQKTAVK